jgi:hypothetical protein
MAYRDDYLAAVAKIEAQESVIKNLTVRAERSEEKIAKGNKRSILLAFILHACGIGSAVLLLSVLGVLSASSTTQITNVRVGERTSSYFASDVDRSHFYEFRISDSGLYCFEVELTEEVSSYISTLQLESYGSTFVSAQLVDSVLCQYLNSGLWRFRFTTELTFPANRDVIWFTIFRYVKEE